MTEMNKWIQPTLASSRRQKQLVLKEKLDPVSHHVSSKKADGCSAPGRLGAPSRSQPGSGLPGWVCDMG